jgi:hypothetical protein
VNAYPSDAVEMMVLDPNDEHVQSTGREVYKAIRKGADAVVALAILLVSTEEACAVILHGVTPLPEHNIAMLDRLLTQLRERVLSHADCARALNGTGTTKEPVH